MTSASSVMRLGVAVGLIETHHQDYAIQNYGGLSSFLTMVGCFNHLSTMSCLQSNCLPLRFYQGWMNTLNSRYEFKMRHNLQLLSGDLAVFYTMKEVASQHGDWGLSQISDYWSKNPFASRAWSSSFDMPIGALVAWRDKMKTTIEPKSYMDVVATLGNDSQVLVVALPSSDDYQMMYTSTTIDFFQYRPITVVRRSYETTSYVSMWIDNWSDVTDIRYSKDMGVFMSCPLSIASSEPMYDTNFTPTLISILDCKMANSNTAMALIKFSPINWASYECC